MNPFIKTALQFLPLSEDSIASLEGILKRLELPKGHILLKPETTCHYIYFIESGLTRTFYLWDGKDVTDWISVQQSFSCSIVSFVTRKPDIRGIELLEDSVLWAMHHDDLDRLYDTSHELERLGRFISNFGLVQVQQRFDDLHFATAYERYKKLMDTSPSIILRVPLGMIASYLGITQETLSRIRAQYNASG